LLASAGASLAGCGGNETGTSSGGTTTSTSTTPTGSFGPLGDRMDLPVDERLQLDNLSGPVDVVRDKYGRPHIYAANVADSLRVEGYLMARDRTLQLEVLRRLSEGRMAEILGIADETLIDTDISFRHIGLHRVAKAQYAALKDGDLKTALDSFADGVTQAYHKLKSGDLQLPAGIVGIKADYFTDWKGDDSLAIGRLQTYLLSYDGDSDVSAQQVFDATRSVFRSDAADPLAVKRTGFERDMFRFAPATKATTTDGYPMGAFKSHAIANGQPKQAPKSTPVAKDVLAHSMARTSQARGYLAALQKVRRLLASEGFGSNNWGVMPAKSATGHTIIASDPHLNLTAPAIFYPVSIEVKSKDTPLVVGGVAFPGIPGIILGHNENVAWGATVAGYDVSDAYVEELSADGKSVKFQGKDVPIQVIEEPIVIQGKDQPYVYKVQMVPHHGPILPTINQDHTVADPDPKKGAISIKWTGLEPTDEIAAVFKLLQAKNVDDAYQALQSFGVGAQNWMVGDTSGNLLWTSHAHVPVRDPKAFAWDAAKYEGTLPQFVLPGDGTAEWGKDYLKDDLVPWVKNPAKGYVSTANNDPIGDTLDNDPSNDKLPDGTPMYLGSQFDIGFREERIHTRLEAKTTFGMDDIASVQADHHSPMGSRVVPRLLTAIEHAQAEHKTPGSHPDLSAIVKDAAYDDARMTAAHQLLDDWGKKADYDAPSGVDPDTNMPLPKDQPEAQASSATLLFNIWLERAMKRIFGDELGKVGYSSWGREIDSKALLHLLEDDPSQLATFDAATGDSAIWDDMGTPEIESREERLVRALLDAFAWVDSQKAPIEELRWGTYHTVRFDAIIPIYGDLSIPPTSDKTFKNGFPRPADSFAVDNADFSLNTALGDTPDFTYSHGPCQRFVIDLDPAGVKAYNAIPGGNVWDASSKHFDDEAQLWRKNKNHFVPFTIPDVAAAKESRWVFSLDGK
jgi:penicillin amidase